MEMLESLIKKATFLFLLLIQVVDWIAQPVIELVFIVGFLIVFKVLLSSLLFFSLLRDLSLCTLN